MINLPADFTLVKLTTYLLMILHFSQLYMTLKPMNGDLSKITQWALRRCCSIQIFQIKPKKLSPLLKQHY